MAMCAIRAMQVFACRSLASAPLLLNARCYTSPPPEQNDAVRDDGGDDTKAKGAGHLPPLPYMQVKAVKAKAVCTLVRAPAARGFVRAARLAQQEAAARRRVTARAHHARYGQGAAQGDFRQGCRKRASNAQRSAESAS